jgi:beta-glucosidase
VPRTLLHPSAGDPAFGLKGEYFDNIALDGQPAFTRVDPQIDFDWNSAPPGEHVSASAFSVRWTGTIAVPKSGDYPFSFTLAHCYPCGDVETVRFFLDGAPVNDIRTRESPFRPSSNKPFTLTFADAKPHRIRVEYAHRAPLFGAGLTFNWMPNIEAERDEAVRAAQQADAVVAFVGLSPELEGEEMPVHVAGFSGGDRTSIELPEVQQHLLESLAGTGKPLIVVLMNGSALAARWAQEHASAILEAWYPGEEGGNAIARTLAGDNNPSGRLPVTFYAGTDQLPAFDDYAMTNRTYRYFRGKPLWGFGYGMSYSTFRWRDLKLSSTNVQAGNSLEMDAEVENLSDRPGDAVSEVYLVPSATPTAPIRALVAFARTPLKAHGRQPIHLVIDPRALSTVGAAGKRAIQPGHYSVFLGGAQPGDDPNLLSATFTISGTKDLPR